VQNNAFIYKLKSCPPEILQMWTEMKGGRNSDRKDAFKDKVIAATRNTFKDVVAEFTSVSKTKKVSGDTSSSGWVAWQKFASERGADQVKEMIRMGTVRHITDPALVGSTI
jgi:hypothetical protein